MSRADALGERLAIPATLNQLKTFESVARHGSFTRAAEELSVTQPTVSSQVKQLSQAIALPLFEQIGKQLYLTEAGRELLGTCRDIFESLDHFEMRVAELKGRTRGKLRLAAVTTTKYFIPRLLGKFCDRYPEVDVSLQVINHQQITRRMLENQDDLYVLSQPPAQMDLCLEPFMDNPLVVVCRHDRPLATEKNVSLKRLAREPFIMREQGSGTRKAVEELFVKSEIKPNVRMELGSNEAIKQAIAGGLGISVLSQNALVGDISELAIVDARDFPIQRRWYAVHLRGKQLSSVARSFLQHLLANGSMAQNGVEYKDRAKITSL